jgi:DNA-binding PadR family transcriptional regulator
LDTWAAFRQAVAVAKVLGISSSNPAGWMLLVSAIERFSYQALMRSSGAMTNRLHRLERAGLIERRPDPGDGSWRLVRLTARGRKLVDELAPIHLENEERLLASLTRCGPRRP